jgi:hypothetical protein
MNSISVQIKDKTAIYFYFFTEQKMEGSGKDQREQRVAVWGVQVVISVHDVWEGRGS